MYTILLEWLVSMISNFLGVDLKELKKSLDKKVLKNQAILK